MPKDSLFKPEKDPSQKLEQLQNIIDVQAKMHQQLTTIEGQNIFLVQQLLQVSTLFSQQSNTFVESETALRNELKRFQTGGVQYAMSSVFSKMFRDLLKHMEQLESLTELGLQEERSDQEKSWIDVIVALREGFEVLLRDWGCTPIPIEIGKELFDPEIHEAVHSNVGDIPPGMHPNVIVRVRRRGWKLQGIIIQYPQVIVS